MTKQHELGYYEDNRVQVAYCKKCSAEGLKLLEDCPQKVSLSTVDPEKIIDDFENYS